MFAHARLVAALIGGLAALPQSAMAGPTRSTATVLLAARVESHRSLRVSTSTLRFEVVDGQAAPRVAIDYRAAARTVSGADVVLTLQPVGELRTEDGESVRGLVVRYDADAFLGTLAAERQPQTVGRWRGGGVRTGSIDFTLLGARRPGVYLLELKFVLSAP